VPLEESGLSHWIYWNVKAYLWCPPVLFDRKTVSPFGQKEKAKGKKGRSSSNCFFPFPFYLCLLPSSGFIVESWMSKPSFLSSIV
jgi:hypothetical protein